jgi:hypothetical protein
LQEQQTSRNRTSRCKPSAGITKIAVGISKYHKSLAI